MESRLPPFNSNSRWLGIFAGSWTDNLFSLKGRLWPRIHVSLSTGVVFAAGSARWHAVTFGTQSADSWPWNTDSWPWNTDSWQRLPARIKPRWKVTSLFKTQGQIHKSNYPASCDNVRQKSRVIWYHTIWLRALHFCRPGSRCDDWLSPFLVVFFSVWLDFVWNERVKEWREIDLGRPCDPRCDPRSNTPPS